VEQNVGRLTINKNALVFNMIVDEWTNDTNSTSPNLHRSITAIQTTQIQQFSLPSVLIHNIPQFINSEIQL
jgi:hypothetical protein